MIREMLAGDEIAPTDPDTLRATGFLVRNWFRFNRNVWLQDTIEHIGRRSSASRSTAPAATITSTIPSRRRSTTSSVPSSSRTTSVLTGFRARPIGRKPGSRESTILRPKEALPPDPDEGTVNLLPPIFGDTYVFVRGDERNPEKDHPLSPDIPHALGKLPVEIKPVELSLTAYYPDMREFVQGDLVEQAKHRIGAAEKNSEKATAERLAAEQAMAAPKQPEPSGPPVDFKSQIVPILEKRCFNCHQGRNRKSGLSVASEKEILAGGSKSGPAAIAGKSARKRIDSVLAWREAATDAV